MNEWPKTSEVKNENISLAFKEKLELWVDLIANSGVDNQSVEEFKKIIESLPNMHYDHPYSTSSLKSQANVLMRGYMLARDRDGVLKLDQEVSLHMKYDNVHDTTRTLYNLYSQLSEEMRALDDSIWSPTHVVKKEAKRPVREVVATAKTVIASSEMTSEDKAYLEKVVDDAQATSSDDTTEFIDEVNHHWNQYVRERQDPAVSLAHREWTEIFA